MGPTLPNVSRQSVLFVEILAVFAVARVKHLEDRIEFLWYSDVMDVVRHQTESPDTEEEFSARRSEQIQIALTVCIIPKHIRSANASMRNMVRPPGHDDAGNAWHRFSRRGALPWERRRKRQR